MKLPKCASHLSPSPSEVATQVLAADAAGEGCIARIGSDVSTRQRLLAAPFLADVSLRPLFAPLLLRLSRCSRSDQAELLAAVERFPNLTAVPAATPSFAGTTLDPLVQNLRLASLIIHTDLIRESRSAATIEALERGLLASRGQSRTFLQEHDAWPTPSAERSNSTASKTKAAMLLFAGGLDAQTPLSWSRQVAAEYQGPNQHLVVVPTAGHMTYAFARTVDGENCTTDLWRSFLRDPTSTPDTSCVANIAPFDWAADSAETVALARKYLGTGAVWGTPD